MRLREALSAVRTPVPPRPVELSRAEYETMTHRAAARYHRHRADVFRARMDAHGRRAEGWAWFARASAAVTVAAVVLAVLGSLAWALS